MSINSSLELLVVVLLGTAGQVALKYALRPGAANDGRFGSRMLFNLLSSRYLWAWFFSYIIATVLWLIVLKTVPLSQAFPLMGFTFAAVPLASSWFLKENVSGVQWAGIVFIVMGVVLIIQE